MTSSAGALRADDLVRLSCPYTPALVTDDTDREFVFLKWPWWQVDPDAVGYGWNGVVAIGRPGNRGELFRVTPRRPRRGETCQVGIPPTLVRVREIAHYDPPRMTGRLPRPSREIVVQVPDDPDGEGYSFDPDDDIPIAYELVFRPYPFLEPGDDVADAAGRAWTFVTPSEWRAFDGQPGAPVWPLTLLSDPQRADAVATATREGTHEAELARSS